MIAIIDQVGDSLRNDSLQKVMKDSMDKVMNSHAPVDTTQTVSDTGILAILKPFVRCLSGLTQTQLMILGVVTAMVGFVMIVTMWKIFTKAGKPGWVVLIPIYNIITLIRVSGRPGWWIFLWILVIPMLLLPFDMARRFGKSTGFAIGLLLLNIIFYPILAFGSAKYTGVGAKI